MKHWYSVAVFLLLVQLQVSAANVLFVTAYPNGAPCPIDAEICHNISYYFEQGNSLIKDNVIIIFLNGTHVIPSIRMKISQLNNITLQGDATNYITTPILQCKKGFYFSQKQGTCVCIDKVMAVATCYSSTQSIERSGTEWIGYNIQQNCVIVSNLCPSDYCLTDSVNITNISNSNVQCTTNRTGQRCGGCIDGYSLVLGSNACKNCSGKDSHLSLIILFAVAGFALVVFLLFFNLTVSIGTINGLVFVANIGKLFQPYDLYHHNIPFFSQFFLWINLDLGIETCFYDGMNALKKTGLQFVFPLYLWLIITLIIVLSKYSQRIAKIVGNNGIPVLATLILLSYTKIIRAVIIIFSRTTVQCGNNTMVNYWRVDPTQKYVSGGHIILFIIGVIVTALFIIPYTAFLLFYPLLELSGEKYRQRFSWFFLKLKPFFDAYRGPHTNLFCIWPGVLLLVRIGLPLVSFSNNRKVTFAVILLVLVVLIAILSNGRVYKSKYLNVLDVCLFAMALVFTYSDSGEGSNNQEKFNFTNGFGICTSISLMLVFVVVLCYHAYKYTIIGEKIGKIMKKVKFNKESNHNFNKESDLIQVTSNDQAEMPAYKMYDGGKLREPLLEDSY